MILALFLLAVVLALNSVPLRWLNRGPYRADRLGRGCINFSVGVQWKGTGGYKCVRVAVGTRSIYVDNVP